MATAGNVKEQVFAWEGKDKTGKTVRGEMRAGGEADGRPLGVLGIHFDWAPQAQAVVDGVRLTPGEAARTRVLLTDAQGLVLAASDRQGVLEERVRLPDGAGPAGFRSGAGGTIAWHRTPGYETYRGLGWHGVLVQAG